MSMVRRVGEPERRMRERSPERCGAAARRERMKDLLDRYASAKRTGALTGESEGEIRAVREAMGRPKPGGRGEG
jgi:hypothetical protein